MRLVLVLVTFALLGCSGSANTLGPSKDSGTVDAGGGVDGGPDAGSTPDAGSSDAGSSDAGPSDAGRLDGGMPADAGARTDFGSLLEDGDLASAVLGATAAASLGITDAPGLITTDPLDGGFKVVKDAILADNHNAFGFGGTFDLPHNLLKGDEIWVSFKLLFPSGFDHSAQDHLKFMRLRVRDAAGTHVGFDDVYLFDDDHFEFIFEGAQQWEPLDAAGDASQGPTLGQWHTFEYHLVADDVAEASGGTARVDFWRDGVRVGSITDRTTLSHATDQLWSYYLFTYWNEGYQDSAPGIPSKNESFYWTNYRVGVKAASWGSGPRDDSLEMITDADGRKMIGL